MNLWPTWLPLRQDLRELSAYGAPQVPADAVMNTNENPYPLSQELSAAIAARVLDAAKNLNRYPDRDATVLRSKLAQFINNLSATGCQWQQRDYSIPVYGIWKWRSSWLYSFLFNASLNCQSNWRILD